jgi:copper chaperone CopZ
MPMPTPSAPAPTPTPTPTAKAPEPAPTFSGSVRIATFTDIIASAGDKKASGTQVDSAKVEAALKRISGVTSVSVDSNGINVGFSGPYSEIKKLKIAVETQGVSSEILSPARVIVRPMSQIEDASSALNALKGVGGVAAAEKEANDLIAYADLSTVSLDSLIKAVEGTGVKCQIASHEEIKVKFSAAGQTEQLKSDLAATKWVLKVEIVSAESSVKVVAVKGRVTRSVVKSVMAKHGFPEAK